MGKSDEKLAKKKGHEATGESKHKNTPSFDTLGSRPFAMSFEATDDEGVRQSQWPDHFRQLCEYKVQFGHSCHVSLKYSSNPKLGAYDRYQCTRYREYTTEEAKPTYGTAEHIRALDSI
jgi:hypothetical protein